jgi:hypothetical protein
MERSEGEARSVEFGREARTFSLEDYPPGTPLPEVDPYKGGGGPSLGDPTTERRWSEFMARRRARLEKAREEYWKDRG